MKPRWVVNVMILWGGLWTWARFTLRDQERARALERRAKNQGRNAFVQFELT